VFTSPKGAWYGCGTGVDAYSILRSTAAGLGELTPHELRHTAASLAVAANVKAVQRMLGHACAAMTLDVYSGLFEDDLDAVADRLDAGARTARGLPATLLPAEGC